MSPRAWRWKSGTLRLSSSALIWRETADWLRLSISPAWVKLPASATAWKIRSLSQSIIVALRASPQCRASIGCLSGGGVLFGGEEALGFERGHAAHAGGGHRLTEDLIFDVASRKHARNAGRGRIGSGLYIAFRIHDQLALEDLRRRRVPDSNE